MSAPSSTSRAGLGRAAPVAILGTAIPITGAILTVVLAPWIAPWLRGQGTAGVVYFTLAFIIAGALTLAPTYTTSVLAGWTFGFAWAFPAILCGTVGGAAISYSLARWLARDRVQETFARHPRWEIVRQALLEENRWKAMWIVFLMRLSPVLPFGTTNVLLATTGVPFGSYVLGTLLGLAPRTGLIALAAAGAERLDLKSAESWGLLLGGIGATCLCIVVMAMIGRKALDRATAR